MMKRVLRLMIVLTTAALLAGCGTAEDVSPSPSADHGGGPSSGITPENCISYTNTKQTQWQTSFENNDGFLGSTVLHENIASYRDFSLRSGDCVSLIRLSDIDCTPVVADGFLGALFDDSSSSKYIVLKNPTEDDPVFLTLPLRIPASVCWYTITSGNDEPSRDPLNWRFEGSDNGTDWKTLHSVDGYDFPQRSQTHLFTFQNDRPYQSYRLIITKTRGGNAYTQICGLRMGTSGAGMENISYLDRAAFSTSFPYNEKTDKAVINVELDQAACVNWYSLISGSGSVNNDPKDWRLLGSSDGKEWTELHSVSTADFTSRMQAFRTELFNAEVYKYYRLEITAAALGDSVTLQGFDLGVTKWSEGEPAVSIGAGPDAAWGSVAGKGWTGENALMFAGTHIGSGSARAEAVLYDNLNIKLEPNIYLSYKIFPDFAGKYDYEYTSQYAALDIEFTDGTRLSELNATDQYGYELSAKGQGDSQVLYTRTWNEVVGNLGAAAGKTVKSILVVYDKRSNDNSGCSIFRTYFDDIKLYKDTSSDKEALADYVNILRGTYPNTHVSSPTRGSGTPLIAVPGGFNQFAPVNALGSQRVYTYHLEGSASKLYHMSLVHFPNQALGDYSEYSFMINSSIDPSAVKAADLAAPARGAAFKHENEIEKAHYYSVSFDEGGTAGNCRMEVTPASHSAMMRFTFDKSAAYRNIIFDCPRGAGNIEFGGNGSFSGYTDMKQENVYYGDSGARRMYFYGYTDASPESAHAFGKTAIMSFGGDEDTVTMRLGTSFISLEQAQKNLELEIKKDQTFEQTACDAKTAWESILAKVRVEGGTEDQMTSFYSSLYRMYLWPSELHENIGTEKKPVYAYANPYKGTQVKPEITEGKMYVGTVVWDNYRNTWPAYALLTPSLAGELADGLLEHTRQLGWTPKAMVPKSIVCMNAGCDNILSDLAMKGVKFDYEEAFNALLKEVNCYNPDQLGRQGTEILPYTGYLPLNVSSALEYAIGDYSLAKFAAVLGKDDEAAYLLNRSKAYASYYTVVNGEGWLLNGYGPHNNAWGDNFDPVSWALGYCESNAWQIALYATHDIQGMISLYGGSEAMVKKLDDMFAAKNSVNYPYDPTWCYMVEARECKTGQYNHGNQPDHAFPYLYAYASRPDKTQQRVRDILSRLYTGSSMGCGYPGDDDTGEMSAWYVFSAMGFYPVELADNNYTIGSPLFDKVTLTLQDGKTFTVTARNNSKDNVYIQSVKLNGQPYDKITLNHNDITAGGTLEFIMGSEPSGWGAGAESLPGTCVTPSGELPSMCRDMIAASQVHAADVSMLGALFDDTSLSDTTFAGGTDFYWTPSSACSVGMITLTSASQGNAPAGFELYGSNDGSSWTLLESRNNLEFPWNRYLRPFTVHDNNKYSYYRLRLNGEGRISLSEIELLNARADTV